MSQNLFQGVIDSASSLQGLQDETYKSQMVRQQDRMDMQDRAAQQQQADQLNVLKQQYADEGSPEVMRQIIMADPEFSSKLQDQFGLVDDQVKSKAINEAGALKKMIETNPEQAAQFWQENLSQNPAFAGLADNFQSGDIEGALNEIGWGVTLAGGQQAYDSIFSVEEAQEPTAPSSVREWEYYNGLDDAQKQQYINMKRANQLYKQGDVTMQVDPVQGGGAAVVEQGQQPIGQAGMQSALTDQAATKAATVDAAKQAIALSEDAFNKLGTVRTASGNLDEAIRLVDEGANTGVITSKLPSVQKASIELDNLQGQMGLDVIGNTTFGALSESELKFALDTALPRNLDGPELKDWLLRKKESQEKLTAYLEDAAIYLGTPGNNVAGFIKDRQSGGQEPKVTIEDSQSLDDLMSALGG